MATEEKRMKLNEVVHHVGLEELVANAHLADMEFFIKSENITIPAHKLIIGFQSLLLKKFVYGTDEWPATNPLPVENISSAAFKEILMYLYAKKINFSEENALSIWKTAHYYEIIEIEEKCEFFLIENLKLSNVLECFEESYLMGKKCRLYKESLKYIKITFEEILTKHANKLFDMNLDVTNEILSLDKINLSSERQLFNQMIKYAAQKCLQKSIEVTGQNKRKEIDTLLKFVRFPAMSSNDFVELLKSEPNIFSSEEIGDITKAIINVNVHSLYLHKPRIRLNIDGFLINTNFTVSSMISEVKSSKETFTVDSVDNIIAIKLFKNYNFNMRLTEPKLLLLQDGNNFKSIPITMINGMEYYYLLLDTHLQDPRYIFNKSPKGIFKITFETISDYAIDVTTTNKHIVEVIRTNN